MRLPLLLALFAAACSESAPTPVASHDASTDTRPRQVDGVAPSSDAPTHVSGDADRADVRSHDSGVNRDGGKGPDATEHETGLPDTGASDAPTYRNPLVQPFASDSIWNTSIGSAATYVPATIATATGNTLSPDDDVIVLTPTAPVTEIFRSKADWNPDVSRCPYDAGAQPILEVPLPASFIVGDTPTSNTPNSGLAVLMGDNRTIDQTQPFARCTANMPATSDAVFAPVDLYGPGITGAHGGSGLSAIGGTLRLGELRPSTSPPHHVLKLELYAHDNYYNDGQQADCYRWPATGCDGYFDDSSSSIEYGGSNSEVRPGSLLALPASLSITSLNLTTEPAKLLAWTLQNYGAYLVDDSAWSDVNMCVENGTAGSFEAQFQSDWGFAFDTGGTTTAFAKDLAAIYAALNVVSNNGPSTVGGGGTPLQPPALPLPPPPAGD